MHFRESPYDSPSAFDGSAVFLAETVDMDVDGPFYIMMCQIIRRIQENDEFGVPVAISQDGSSMFLRNYRIQAYSSR